MNAIRQRTHVVVPFGPDVYFTEDTTWQSMAHGGIFGMRHEQLLTSQWVVDGALTAKFELEVRPNVELDPMPIEKGFHRNTSIHHCS